MSSMIGKDSEAAETSYQDMQSYLSSALAAASER